jgi:hypothetical protein
VNPLPVPKKLGPLRPAPSARIMKVLIESGWVGRLGLRERLTPDMGAPTQLASRRYERGLFDWSWRSGCGGPRGRQG